MFYLGSMTDFITALTGTNGISADALWTSVTGLAGIIVIGVLFSFGYRVAKRVLSGISKGKARL